MAYLPTSGWAYAFRLMLGQRTLYKHMSTKTWWAAGAAGTAARVWARQRRQLKLKGRHVLITGGSRGLGLALACELVQAGARVALLARDELQLVKARDSILGSQGQEVDLAVCDLREPEQIKLVVALLLARWGQIDVLINNAGIIQLGPVTLTDVAEFENAMAVHFWAPLHTMREVIPSMRKQGGGRIVNISSIEGKLAFPLIAPYCASKFALIGLSDAYRTELAREHIYVTTVAPGLMRTGSPSDAQRAGERAREHRWLSTAFSMGLAVPLWSMSAERAARRIVRACVRGERSLELGLATKVLIRAQALSPSVVGAMMELVNGLLPRVSSVDGAFIRSGWQNPSRSSASLLPRLADRQIEPDDAL